MDDNIDITAVPTRCLATPDMTDLEVLGIVRESLLAQRGPSVATNPMGTKGCMYRGSQGRACAVGVLISDEAYDACLESHVLDDFPGVWNALVESGVPDRSSTRSMLIAAQSVHDGYVLGDDPPGEWGGFIERGLSRLTSRIGPDGLYAESPPEASA